jgi:uncharacterized protein Usg
MGNPFNPESFDPRVLADSLEDEIERQFQDSLLPVNLVTSITYEPQTDGHTVITDGHMVADHPFVWGFMDFAPFYIRLRVYLRHWLETIEADIVEVRIASDQFEDVISAKSGIEAWMHTGDSTLIH